MPSIIEHVRVTADKKADRKATGWVVDIDFMSDADVTNEDVEEKLTEAIEELGDSDE